MVLEKYSGIVVLAALVQTWRISHKMIDIQASLTCSLWVCIAVTSYVKWRRIWKETKNERKKKTNFKLNHQISLPCSSLDYTRKTK